MSKSPAQSPAQLAAGFIAEALDELVDLAARHGHQGLADVLTRAMGEAVRAAHSGPDRRH
ncbi:hypothetical protein [Phenylobacterium aquaticum]|uniref:hypothetical protein n=1 Tax=Phenylobacterium aquaticum TaxID=1763816 RepID=UPI0026F17FFA|nr:hypothetical protein [Phenylobacterium aquaticum]